MLIRLFLLLGLYPNNSDKRDPRKEYLKEKVETIGTYFENSWALKPTTRA